MRNSSFLNGRSSASPVTRRVGLSTVSATTEERLRAASPEATEIPHLRAWSRCTRHIWEQDSPTERGGILRGRQAHCLVLFIWFIYFLPFRNTSPTYILVTIYGGKGGAWLGGQHTTQGNRSHGRSSLRNYFDGKGKVLDATEGVG